MASIYERIGGAPAVTAAVDIFYNKMLADPRVNYWLVLSHSLYSLCSLLSALCSQKLTDLVGSVGFLTWTCTHNARSKRPS
jgi:truncated hemoglobin YjbI